MRPPTQSRHSVYKKNHLVCSLERARRAYTSALAGWPLLDRDTTIVDTLTSSYIAVSTQSTGSAAQTVAERKVSKYTGLLASHLFVPIAIESLSPINEAGHSFLSEL